jgi:hypothetical protein
VGSVAVRLLLYTAETSTARPFRCRGLSLFEALLAIGRVGNAEPRRTEADAHENSTLSVCCVRSFCPCRCLGPGGPGGTRLPVTVVRVGTESHVGGG